MNVSVPHRLGRILDETRNEEAFHGWIGEGDRTPVLWTGEWGGMPICPFFAHGPQRVERQPGLGTKVPALPTEGLESRYFVAVRPSVSPLKCLGFSFLVCK